MSETIDRLLKRMPAMEGLRCESHRHPTPEHLRATVLELLRALAVAHERIDSLEARAKRDWRADV